MFLAADKLRGNMEPSDYKHVALGLIFLKHISDSLRGEACGAARRASGGGGRPGRVSGGERLLGAEGGALVAPSGQRQAADHRQADRRGDGRDREGQSIAQGRPAQGLCPPRAQHGDARRADRPHLRHRHRRARDKSRDVLGRVYEYFLGQFAGSEGKRGGEFYTPRSVVAHCWSRCWSPITAASTIPAAARAACSFSRRSSSRATAAGSATSPFTARNRTTRPGGCAR